MDKGKELALARKHNAELMKQLEDAKLDLKLRSDWNKDSYSEARGLIKELEQIKADWSKCLKELERSRMEYSVLVGELRAAKKIMTQAGFKLPLHKRVILRVYKLFHREDEDDTDDIQDLKL